MPDFDTKPNRELIFADFKDLEHANRVKKRLHEYGVRFRNLAGEHCDVMRVREHARDYESIRLDLWYSTVTLLFMELKDARQKLPLAGYDQYSIGAGFKLRDTSGRPLVDAETLGSLDVAESDRFLWVENNQLLERQFPLGVEDPASATILSGLAVVLQHR